MEFILGLIGLALVVGVVVAVLERRRGAIFLKHDLTLRGQSTEASREAERTAQAIREAQQRSMMKHH